MRRSTDDAKGHMVERTLALAEDMGKAGRATGDAELNAAASLTYILALAIERGWASEIEAHTREWFASRLEGARGDG